MSNRLRYTVCAMPSGRDVRAREVGEGAGGEALDDTQEQDVSRVGVENRVPLGKLMRRWCTIRSSVWESCSLSPGGGRRARATRHSRAPLLYALYNAQLPLYN